MNAQSHEYKGNVKNTKIGKYATAE